MSLLFSRAVGTTHGEQTCHAQATAQAVHHTALQGVVCTVLIVDLCIYSKHFLSCSNKVPWIERNLFFSFSLAQSATCGTYEDRCGHRNEGQEQHGSVSFHHDLHASVTVSQKKPRLDNNERKGERTVRQERLPAASLPATVCWAWRTARWSPNPSFACPFKTCLLRAHRVPEPAPAPGTKGIGAVLNLKALGKTEFKHV